MKRELDGLKWQLGPENLDRRVAKRGTLALKDTQSGRRTVGQLGFRR
jgi:hypothetical protein